MFAVLEKYYERMFYFFNDMQENHQADQNFTRRLLTCLDCRILEPGQVMQHAGAQVENIYFNYQNKVNVLDGRQVFVLATLPEGSWFGDFNAFFDVTSAFSYVAHYEEDKNGMSTPGDDHYRIMMLMCPVDKFIALLQDYP